MLIGKEQTVLDIVSKYQQTIDVFRHYDKEVGVCICCEALFDPLEQIARRYDIDLTKLLIDLNAAAKT